MFSLNEQLGKDCFIVGEFTLCEVLLLNDVNFPWLILVPKVEGVSELHHLTESQQQQFLKESGNIAAMIESLFKPDKLNIAAIGNKVRQLHIHHIGRFESDPCWPETVWGYGKGIPYTDQQRDDTLARIRNFLSDLPDFTY
ncbi:MAG: HIT domain-containing protein [Gammaproteobacteria bacterium]|nr:HIT domain-containing protein [Gammaproteobacteria bacterium]